ncbi:GtrA family protein [Cohnella faecalis]|uniref:GtrA family protein n=1 Tax=Cohnella faecalis TaxID=2315694 RepID=A0A398CTY8_9BACL|nr:GtrA family protein [Cohnella faecalis]RIE02781.1 GtrA family protein [Cohnella faecalis]
MRLRSEESRKLVKYALVGGMNSGVDFAVFVSLVYAAGMTSLWAQVLSYTAGLLNSYFWNRRWTFGVKRKQTVGEMVRFIVVNGLSFGVATAVLLLLEHWGFGSIFAKIVSFVFGLVVNYAGYRAWVFRGHTPQPETHPAG